MFHDESDFWENQSIYLFMYNERDRAEEVIEYMFSNNESLSSIDFESADDDRNREKNLRAWHRKSKNNFEKKISETYQENSWSKKFRGNSTKFRREFWNNLDAPTTLPIKTRPCEWGEKGLSVNKLCRFIAGFEGKSFDEMFSDLCKRVNKNSDHIRNNLRWILDFEQIKPPQSEGGAGFAVNKYNFWIDADGIIHRVYRKKCTRVRWVPTKKERLDNAKLSPEEKEKRIAEAFQKSVLSNRKRKRQKFSHMRWKRALLEREIVSTESLIHSLTILEEEQNKIRAFAVRRYYDVSEHARINHMLNTESRYRDKLYNQLIEIEKSLRK